ncbi:hypothetical protein GCK32_012089 [Trichostrongylus colubriformis]|uniref:Uncharacterized protein n=1 Tax=Trichostrongylus colubriformis TaxID=6319 RepID=A0AAN8FLJ8_TRICO
MSSSKVLVSDKTKETKKLRSEQLLSLIRRLNESSWRSHTVLLPIKIFFDQKDSEICRQLLRPFFEVLQPNTIWIGNVKPLPESTKKNPYTSCEYALTVEDLQAEKVTVSCGDSYGVAEEKKSSDNSSLLVKEKSVTEKSVQSETTTEKSAQSGTTTEKSAQSGTTTENLMANKNSDVFDPFAGSGRKVEPPDSGDAGDHREDDEEDEYLD